MDRIGLFIKTSSPPIVELLALSGFGFGILDAEHSVYDRFSLDLMMMGGRAAGMPLFVRIPDHATATILQSLDIGAQGLIVPHVDTPEQAEAIVRRARFEGGERGYSNFGRFGRYGMTSVHEAIAIGDRAEIICQIESPEAVRNAEAIAAMPGVTGLLVGRADLALSMGLRDFAAAAVREAAEASLAAARRHGKTAAIVIGDAHEVAPWAAAGADMFVFGNEYALLRGAATALVGRVGEALAAVGRGNPSSA